MKFFVEGNWKPTFKQTEKSTAQVEIKYHPEYLRVKFCDHPEEQKNASIKLSI